MKTGDLIFYAVPSDRPKVDAVLSAIQKWDAEICAAMQSECGFPVDVEIYPDQTAFDQNVMNPTYQGFYAISGARRIQMVSPVVAQRSIDLDYEERVLIAVHEYVHLVEDEINPDVPTWVDEGVAVSYGPYKYMKLSARPNFLSTASQLSISWIMNMRPYRLLICMSIQRLHPSWTDMGATLSTRSYALPIRWSKSYKPGETILERFGVII